MADESMYRKTRQAADGGAWRSCEKMKRVTGVRVALQLRGFSLSAVRGGSGKEADGMGSIVAAAEGDILRSL